jgi:cell division protein FtsQ
MWHDVRTLNATTNALLGVLVLSLLASGLWWVANRPMFTLTSIQVEAVGEMALKHVNAPTIRTTAVPRLKGNFFTANLDEVRQAFEAVPWVRKASVRREWPNKLIVQVEEHEPLATWGDDGRLVSVKGDIFTANLDEAEEDGELPEFHGPEGSEKEILVRYRELQDWFKPIEVTPEALQLSSRYAWTVKLSNGMTVELGREQSKTTLKDRVDRLIGIYPQLVSRLQDKIESVDMRYPNGLALKAPGVKFGTDSKKAKR